MDAQNWGKGYNGRDHGAYLLLLLSVLRLFLHWLAGAIHQSAIL